MFVRQDALDTPMRVNPGVELLGHRRRVEARQRVRFLLHLQSVGQHRLRIKAAVILTDQDKRNRAVELAQLTCNRITG